MAPNPTTPEPPIPHDELVARVLFALLRPAVRLATLFGVGLKELTRLLESAHYQEARARTATQRDVADALGVSARTADRLARQSREAFVVPEVEHHLPRRIEFMLAAMPMSAARLVQIVHDATEGEVLDALAALERDGRVTTESGRTTVYRPAAGVRSLPRDRWVNRIGGLESFGENLSNAAWGRFFADDPRAFARTLSFRLTDAQLTELDAWYQQSVLPVVIAWSEAAEATEDAPPRTAMQLSLCWAPYEAMEQATREALTPSRVSTGEDA